jgi:hypothetical protein
MHDADEREVGRRVAAMRVWWQWEKSGGRVNLVVDRVVQR